MTDYASGTDVLELFDTDSIGWSGEQRLAMAVIAGAVADVKNPKMTKSSNRGEMERDYLSAIRFFDESNEISTLDWLAAGLGISQPAIDSLRATARSQAYGHLRRSPERFRFSKGWVESWAGTDEQSLADHYSEIMERKRRGGS